MKQDKNIIVISNILLNTVTNLAIWKTIRDESEMFKKAQANYHYFLKVLFLNMQRSLVVEIAGLLSTDERDISMYTVLKKVTSDTGREEIKSSLDEIKNNKHFVSLKQEIRNCIFAHMSKVILNSDFSKQGDVTLEDSENITKELLKIFEKICYESNNYSPYNFEDIESNTVIETKQVLNKLQNFDWDDPALVPK